VLRLALHPKGLAPRTVNLAEWRMHLLARLRRQIELSADPALIALLRELESYPAARGGNRHSGALQMAAAVVLPLRLQTEDGILSLFGTVTVFGTPIDVTVAELALACFYPADPATAEALRRAAAKSRDPQSGAATG
jgi:MmyB-like transcription regulator ligand binding domain